MRVETRQILAARGFLGWSQADFAKRSGLAVGSIRAVEGDAPAQPSGATVSIAVATLMAAGVRFHTVEGRPAVSLSPGATEPKPALPEMESIGSKKALSVLSKAGVDPQALADALVELKALTVTESMSQVIQALGVAYEQENRSDDG